MKKYVLPLVFVFAAVLVLSACSAETPTPDTAVIPAEFDVLIAEGRLAPVNSMEQAFTTGGQVAEVLVKDGDTVTEGQVLARLSSSPEAQALLVRAQQEVLAARQALDALKVSAQVNLAQGRLGIIQAEAAVDQAEETYAEDRTNENKALLDAARAQLSLVEAEQAELESGEGINPDQMASAEARLAAAEAAVRSAQASVDAAELKASLSGTIVDSNTQVGELVAAGQPVFTVADFSSWVVKTDNLNEIDVVSLEVGQPVSIILDALPDQDLAGEITHINMRYEEKRGDITYTVTTVLNQTDPRMRWGMTAAVEFRP